MITSESIKLIRSADAGNSSIIRLTIVPGEKTPWHYHTLFSETFEILEGALEIGLNNQVHQLKEQDVLTIKPNEKHYFHNIAQKDCVIRATISPGNKNFENSLLISKGLAKDGLAGSSGAPKKIADLALFVYLNNSKIVGIQKIAAPVFNYLARRAIRSGRLSELEFKYCRHRDTLEASEY